ncbi:hypothetical protein ATN84_06195 [Paramesorhizobium deserti]|uniref:Uncharacterized protein n=2 Tax=Paramesorhizobium deserti TaxID=1494590 RepID=A0A135I1I8_9HYPH|nr:hypothetical protein ATN84_06195 [Paramesorhizobium deserti]
MGFALRIGACAIASAAALAASQARADAVNGTKIALAATSLHADHIAGIAGPPVMVEDAGNHEVLIIRPPTHPSVAAIVPAANTTCESAVVLRGRGFMYGIARGETPVLDHPHCAR